MDLHPIRPVESQWIYTQFDWSNSTGHKLLVKLGVNSLRLHSMAAWSNLVVIISMDLHPIRPVESQWIYTQFDWSNSTGHKLLVKLGVNSLRLHSMAAWSNLVVIISMDLHTIRLVEFDWA